MNQRRREILRSLAVMAGASVAGCAGMGGSATRAKVVVVGGGFGGATAAKYLRMWAPWIEVTLVEPNASFVSCPISNLVLAGMKNIGEVTHGYGGLARYGVRRVADTATAIDADRRTVRLARGQALPYDRLILAPGIDFMYEGIPGLNNAVAQSRVLHAWKAGAQTVALRKQLEALPDGGVFAISIPLEPYRCPPGPYERASVIAQYFRRAKPRSKLLVLDANPNIASKAGLFRAAWDSLYKGIIEYRPNSALIDFDVRGMSAKLEVQDVKANLFNVVPPQRAAAIAAPFITANNRWCGVEFQGFESVKVPNVHLIGDAILLAPGMPKSGSMANNHAKVAASAVIARLAGEQPNPAPIIMNTCYSFVSDTEAIHVASAHKYDPGKRTLLPVPGSGGVSPARSALEGQYAMGWARNIWADMLE